MAGWPLPAPFTGRGEESPGSTEPGCRVTPGGGDPRESATENIPPAPPCADLPVRVKRCGKSAPPGRQRAGHGKPHPEQDHVGTRVARWRYVTARQARFRADVRVGCLTGPATAPLDEWPSPGNRYRTRLTGHLAAFDTRHPTPPALTQHRGSIRGLIPAAKPPKSEQKQNNIGNLSGFQSVTRRTSN